MKERMCLRIANNSWIVFLFVWSLLAGGACQSEPATHPPRSSPPPAAQTLFRLLSPHQSGIKFENALPENDRYSILSYEYYYNGGGVAIGDVNGDGRSDIFFTANLVANRLYLNQGQMRFTEASQAAGLVSRPGWKTGVAMADVNGDGHLDFYICRSGKLDEAKRRNELFLNQGDGTFQEVAAQWGLDDSGNATHAAFFDYDRDGDLDMYLLNHALSPSFNLTVAKVKGLRDPNFGDKLFRNDGNRFTDVSQAAGIIGNPIGFGLSVTIGDLNQDGWPDIFVGNDYIEQDYLYLNQQDGSFREALSQSLAHTSHFSMGSDLGDINNDGLPDLMVLDMLPEDNYGQKILKGPGNYDRYQLQVDRGFYHQQMRNTLQLNLGQGRFSEIGQLAGVANTDWSWSPLFADFDNDGYLDLHVSNGYRRASTHLDFIKYDYPAAREAAQKAGQVLRDGAVSQHIPSLHVSNYLFQNQGDLTFTNVSRQWGFQRPSYSNGAAYGDLDQDGDLDLVVNNIAAPAFVYENLSRQQSKQHYLRLKLKGEGANSYGVGAIITAETPSGTLYREQMPTRGFQSSVEPILHLGLGEAAEVSRLKIQWPDGRVQVLAGVAADQLLVLSQKDAQAAVPSAPSTKKPLFEPIPNPGSLAVAHQENAFIDFKSEPLMPHMLSRQGPCLAVADVNGDQLADLFMGGAAGQANHLWIQQNAGDFVVTSLPKPSGTEDIDACWFDADGDGDLDLYCVSGGRHLPAADPAYQDRLYLNDGSGLLRPATNALPRLSLNGACVSAADWDGDGDEDLFVGGGALPGRYPLAEPSLFLRNEGGTFKEVSTEIAPDFPQQSLINDALWSDMDQDGDPDLLLLGEWMAPTWLENTGTGFRRLELTTLAQAAGWWTRALSHDFDGDGDPDYVLGNRGFNAQMQASPTQPVVLYAGDFDKNGTIDPILGYSIQGKTYPLATRDELLNQLNFLKRRFLRYEAYAKATLDEILNQPEFSQAQSWQTHTFASSYLENLGAGKFALRPLPTLAQVAPIYGMLADDYDGDGRADLLLAGNFYPVRAESGRFDAGFGLFLKGDGQGQFEPVAPLESGFYTRGDIRDMKVVPVKGQNSWIVIAKNNAPLQVLRVNSDAR